MAIITKQINFQSFANKGKSASTVIKLMMVCNDLSMANQSLAEWKEKLHNGKSRQAKMYFTRIELSHLNEGLKVIEAIKKDTSLSNIVMQCDEDTITSFNKLKKFLPGGENRTEFENLIGKLRHNLTFHYDESGKLVTKAILDRASHNELSISSITRGDTAHLWHFKAADDIVDSIVVRQIWNIPKNTDASVEADKIAGRVHDILLLFVDFSGEFIWKYCEN